MPDKRPRQVSENSLANLEPKLAPEYETTVVRVTGIRNDVRWFARMTTKERGQIVTKAREAFDQ